VVQLVKRILLAGSCLLLLWVGALPHAHAQQTLPPGSAAPARSIEQVKKDSIVQVKMNEAKAQMQAGRYEQANRTFRDILGMKTVLPNDLTYLFAETLYQIGQTANSKNFLRRYFSLTGTTGQYYDQAKELEERLNKQINKVDRCPACNSKGYVLETCTLCAGTKETTLICSRCQGKTKHVCSRCLGQGTLRTAGPLGTTRFSECPTCKSKGFVSCSKCNGTGNTLETCPRCKGKGQTAGSTVCTHPGID